MSLKTITKGKIAEAKSEIDRFIHISESVPELWGVGGNYLKHWHLKIDEPLIGIPTAPIEAKYIDLQFTKSRLGSGVEGDGEIQLISASGYMIAIHPGDKYFIDTENDTIAVYTHVSAFADVPQSRDKWEAHVYQKLDIYELTDGTRRGFLTRFKNYIEGTRRVIFESGIVEYGTMGNFMILKSGIRADSVPLKKKDAIPREEVQETIKRKTKAPTIKKQPTEKPKKSQEMTAQNGRSVIKVEIDVNNVKNIDTIGYELRTIKRV